MSTSSTHRILAAALAVAGSAVLVAAAPGQAGSLTPTTVTIKAEGTDLSGVVKSSDVTCKDERKVVVYKQVGSRGGGNDKRFATDNASLNGDVYQWSTGNTGTEGRFYAKVRKTETCGGDTSPTIRAQRDD